MVLITIGTTNTYLIGMQTGPEMTPCQVKHHLFLILRNTFLILIIAGLNTPGKVHIPPNDIGANFYPQLGAYSSRDATVISQHMRWIRQSGAGTVVVSWFPAKVSDENGRPWDDLVPGLLDAALKENLRVTFHLEPYKERTVESIRWDVEYLIQ